MKRRTFFQLFSAMIVLLAVLPLIFFLRWLSGPEPTERETATALVNWFWKRP